MMHYKILIIEDEDDTAMALSFYLENQGYEVVCFPESTSAVNFLYDNEVNIILLDMNLPQISGMDSITTIKKYSNVPIIAISAYDDANTISQAIMLGCDDYLAKPFDNKVLLARIYSQLRRLNMISIEKQTEVISYKSNSFYLNNQKILFTAKEYQIFEYLYKNKNNPVKKEELGKILNIDVAKSRALDLHIKNIREKINDNSKEQKFLKSLYAQGLMLNIH